MIHYLLLEFIIQIDRKLACFAIHGHVLDTNTFAVELLSLISKEMGLDLEKGYKFGENHTIIM